MPDIKLPDGSIRSFEQAVTIAEVAASIGAGPNAGATLTIVDVGDGTYTISYTAASGPGDDFVDITLSGVAISGSPYTNSIQ